VFKRWSQRDSAITFDVGTTGVRVCQLRRHGRGLAVRDTLQVQLDERCLDGSQRIDRLARLIQQGQYHGRSVALVTSPPTTLFHALRVPSNLLAHGPAEVQQALAWEIAREIRAAGQVLEVRYWTLPPGHAEGVNVMAVALAREEADRWHAAFARHGLQLNRIDVAPCALARAAGWTWQPQPADAWLLVDLGATRTTITVMLGTTPVYVRPAPVGAAHWTTRISHFFDISEPEAETLKKATRLEPTSRGVRRGGDPGAMGAEDLGAVLFSVIRESLEGLVRDLQLCLAYVQGSYREARPARVILGGGGGEQAGLREYLAQRLELPVQPVLTPDATPEHRGPQAPFALHAAAAVALGSAALELEGSACRP
jgi:type IV pilus assembly protein PilM